VKIPHNFLLQPPCFCSEGAVICWPVKQWSQCESFVHDPFLGLVLSRFESCLHCLAGSCVTKSHVSGEYDISASHKHQQGCMYLHVSASVCVMSEWMSVCLCV
jgi:hypothetical protein